MDFLINYWKQHPIPKYLQVDNGMSFTGDHKHPKSFSRFMRLALYAGIEVVFITPSKPWMNGMIEEFNKGNDCTFLWKKKNLKTWTGIQRKSPTFFGKENKFNA